MKIIRYLIYPGETFSPRDGQWHFVSADRLIALYGVNPAECHIIDYKRPETYAGLFESNYIRLYPRSSGNYTHAYEEP